MFLALESGPPLVAVGILLFRNWRTNYRQQSWFPRRLELSILTGGRLLDGRSLPLPKGEIEAFPAKTEHVALYLQHLLDSTQSYSVVDSAIYAIQWAHNLAGLPSPVDAPIIRDISKAAKKMNGAHVVSRKQAVTADMIGTLVSASNLSNLLDLRNVCLFLLAFAGFFRINEVLHIKYGDVRFQSGYVAIDVTSSKTDQLRKGSEVVIASGSSIDTCPVNILRRYLTEVERYPIDSSHYIFRPLSKCRAGHKLVSVNKPISYSSIRDYFKRSFKDIVLDVSQFGTHSLRAGGASAAANAGVQDRLFKCHGRWKTVSAKNGYVADSLGSRLSVSRMLGI